jgi:hypothetical protein
MQHLEALGSLCGERENGPSGRVGSENTSSRC